jgi:hypothetical protein
MRVELCGGAGVAGGEDFNTSVEMAVRNWRPDANGPMFMASFPVCTGGGAGSKNG